MILGFHIWIASILYSRTSVIFVWVRLKEKKLMSQIQRLQQVKEIWKIFCAVFTLISCGKNVFIVIFTYNGLASFFFFSLLMKRRVKIYTIMFSDIKKEDEKQEIFFQVLISLAFRTRPYYVSSDE